MRRSLVCLNSEVKSNYTNIAHHVDMGTMGQRIRDSRQAAKLTQTQLGRLLGVTKGAVSTWETGRNVPDLPLFIGLCEKLKVSADYILWNKTAHQHPSDVLELAHRIAKLDNKKRELLVSIFSS